MSALDQILQRTTDLIIRYGVKANTMDDVAKNLGMSKKTLYQYFENKKDLVFKCAKSHFERFKKELSKISAESKDAIDELFAMDRHLIESQMARSPMLLHEMNKYYPTVFNKTSSFFKEFVRDLVMKNIERGIEEGLFRDDIKVDIIATLYTNRIEAIVQNRSGLDGKYSFEQIIHENLNYHIRGIASLAGTIKLQEKQTDLAN